MKCSNCESKIGKALIGKDIKALSQDSLSKLNEFLPENLRKDTFCEKCATYRPKVEFPHIYAKYQAHTKSLILTLEKKRNELADLNSEIEIEKGKSDFNFNNIGIFSNTPTHIELIELVESYFVIDSGMWSTSSDNLDAMWSAVHDSIARKGIDSENKLSKGFETSKRFLKQRAFIKGGNTVVDVKYNFSELAGNGKILMYCQGTAGVDKNKKVPSFTEINSRYSERLAVLTDEIDGIDKTLSINSLENFSNLVKSFTLTE